MTENKEVKQTFIMYNSFVDAMANLELAQRWEFIVKLRDYAVYGIDKKSENWGVNFLMDTAKPLLDAAKKRYEKCVENGMKGKEHGKKGGRPKKAIQPQEKPQEEPLNVNVDVNSNVYANVNKNDNLYDNVKDYLKEEVCDKNETDNTTENISLINPTQRTSTNIMDSLEIKDEDDYNNPSSTYPSDLYDTYLKYKFQTPNE